MGGKNDRVTTVNILNRTYQIRSDNEPDYVRQLADYVDSKMSLIAQKTSTVDSLKVAVLAALNIADDYFTTRRKLQQLEQRVQDTTRRVENVLKPLVDVSTGH